MAFDHFARSKVDIAVIETGLGGRLDATNVIMPHISLITQIGLDHQAFLGDTLEEIAGEKAGIIKPKIPVVISGKVDKGVARVFGEYAQQNRAAIHVATSAPHLIMRSALPLHGSHQLRNLSGVLKVLDLLKKDYPNINRKTTERGLVDMVALSGIRGRWEQIGSQPDVFADVGHNENGVSQIVRLVQKRTFEKLYVVWGMVADKDARAVITRFPRDTTFLMCQSQSQRAMPDGELVMIAARLGMSATACGSVSSAYDEAIRLANPEDLIVIGGSTFTVAEVL